MSDRDPFEQMRRSNPFPPGHEPSAPMSMADRIVGAGRGWPGWALTVATAAAVLVVGVGSLWLLGGDDGDAVAGEDTTTTTDTTEAPTVTTTFVVADEPSTGVVYFFQDQVGEGWPGGPYLIPVEVPISVAGLDTGGERLLEEVGQTLTTLLDGRSPEAGALDLLDAVPGLSTAIPAGTELDGYAYDADTEVVTVHLSNEFVSGGGSMSMMGRLAQVVHTLDRIDGVSGVRFVVGGEPTTVFGGEGIVIQDPATAEDFEDQLPAVMIESPAWNGTAGNPLVARGSANVFEATVSLALTDADGLIIWEGFATAACGTGCRGDWEVAIPYAVDRPQMGSLIAWEASAEDGRQLNVREHAVLLTPPDASTITEDGITASQFEGTWLFGHRPQVSMAALHGGIATIDDGCLLVDGAAVVWYEDALPAAQELVDLIQSGETVSVLVGGGGISLDEGGGPLPTIITDRCSVTTVWYGASGEVTIEPAGSGSDPTTTSIVEPSCSAYPGPGADPVLVEQPELPDDVAVVRESIWSAAIRCDWETLSVLAGDEVLASFGQVNADVVAHWREEEDRGGEPLRFLAEILQRPFGILPADGDAVYYVWPSVFAAEDWGQVSQAERDTLRPLYGDEDFASFDEFGGYIGYRAGIYDEPGIAEAAEDYPVWSFFVAGD